MTRLSSSSALAESTMDDHHRSNNHRSQTLTKPTSLTTSTANTVVSKEESFEEVDVGVWGNFTDNFRQVQSILDQNRVLIQQVNENHQSKIHDNMVKNVALIQEINEHISKVRWT